MVMWHHCIMMRRMLHNILINSRCDTSADILLTKSHVTSDMGDYGTAALSPDGKKLIGACGDGDVHVFDVNSKEVIGKRISTLS